MFRKLFNTNTINNQDIARISLIFGAVVLSIVGLSLMFVKVFNILLIVFAGLLSGILFVAFAKKIQRFINMKYLLAASISIIINLAVVGGLLYLIGFTLKPEIQDLASKIPEFKGKFHDFVEESSFAQWIDENTDLLNTNISNGDTSGFFQKFFSTTFGVTGDLYAILFIAIFVAVSPKEYFNGSVSLSPNSWKARTRDVLFQIYNNLKIWLKSQLLEMLIMFVMTGVALYLLGLDYWLVLAILTALFCFIPNIGPMIALVPMVAVGLLDSPEMAFWVFATFMVVQLVETGFIGPYIRKKMLSLPPALVLVFQLILGSVAGIMGILVATPVLVAIIVLVKKLYLQKEFEN